MGSHRAEGPALRRQAAPHGCRRAEPATPAARRRRVHRTHAAPRWVRALPQAGVVAVLGVATIVAPLVGDAFLDEPAAVAEASTATPVAEPTRLTRSQAPAEASDFRVVPVEPSPPSEPPPSLADAATPLLTPEQLAELRSQAEQASRDLERSALPGCDGQVQGVGGSNGRLDTADLCPLWEPEHLLRADAAVTLARLNVEYQNAFGKALCLTDSYRSYSVQERLRASKPGLAAPAGTSEHGWGLAVDLCGGVERDGERHRWMRDNAPRHGWDNPDWAREGGTGPYEPWHWEFGADQA